MKKPLPAFVSSRERACTGFREVAGETGGPNNTYKWMENCQNLRLRKEDKQWNSCQMPKLRSGLHSGRREACGRMKMASSQANVSMEVSCNFTQIQKSLSNLLAKLCFRASDESCRNKFSRCSRTWSANRARALNSL